jgi:hypothetical protein
VTQDVETRASSDLPSGEPTTAEKPTRAFGLFEWTLVAWLVTTLIVQRGLASLGVLELGIAAWLIRQGTRSLNSRREPKGLGGWLVLPAVMPVAIAIGRSSSLVFDYLPLLGGGTWEALTTPGSETHHHLWTPVLVYEIAGNILLVAFAIALLVLMLTKSHRLPRLMIAFLAGNAVFVVGGFLLANRIPAVAAEEDPESVKALVSAFAAAIIWIPYFLVSKRVRNTFLRPE